MFETHLLTRTHTHPPNLSDIPIISILRLLFLTFSSSLPFSHPFFFVLLFVQIYSSLI